MNSMLFEFEPRQLKQHMHLKHLKQRRRQEKSKFQITMKLRHAVFNLTHGCYNGYNHPPCKPLRHCTVADGNTAIHLPTPLLLMNRLAPTMCFQMLCVGKRWQAESKTKHHVHFQCSVRMRNGNSPSRRCTLH